MPTTDTPSAIDTTDVDRYVGQLISGGQLIESVTATDIRRWVQAMQYPNPLHFQADYAGASHFGQIVAPQSFAVCCDVGQGGTPAIVGNIPGSHIVLGGDEWWFYGPVIRPGDRLTQERRFAGYRLEETRFAGPTMFSQGDTLHRNQSGELVATQRATVVRYLADQARQRGVHPPGEPPRWTATALRDVEEQRLRWIRSRQGAKPRLWSSVEIGQPVPIRPIGPHTVQSLATEWRAFIFTVWGASRQEDSAHYAGAGWLPELAEADERAELDPSLADGLYQGPSRGHLDGQSAQLVGLPRAYGYGASMGAWVLDYVAFWAGDHGFIRHSNVQYRFPPFEGDLSLLEGRVSDKRRDAEHDRHLVTVDVVMKNQDDTTIAKGSLDVELPA